MKFANFKRIMSVMIVLGSIAIVTSVHKKEQKTAEPPIPRKVRSYIILLFY